MRLLSVNTGSSPVRIALYAGGDEAPHLLAEQRCASRNSPEHVLRAFIGDEPVDAVAPRVVHGGDKFSGPCEIEAEVEAEIELQRMRLRTKGGEY